MCTVKQSTDGKCLGKTASELHTHRHFLSSIFLQQYGAAIHDAHTVALGIRSNPRRFKRACSAYMQIPLRFAEGTTSIHKFGHPRVAVPWNQFPKNTDRQLYYELGLELHPSFIENGVRAFVFHSLCFGWGRGEERGRIIFTPHGRIFSSLSWFFA